MFPIESKKYPCPMSLQFFPLIVVSLKPHLARYTHRMSYSFDPSYYVREQVVRPLQPLNTLFCVHLVERRGRKLRDHKPWNEDSSQPRLKDIFNNLTEETHVAPSRPRRGGYHFFTFYKRFKFKTCRISLSPNDISMYVFCRI